MAMDILDLKIVRCLTENSRCTYKHMASEAGVSEATIKNRIDKLTEEGIIKKFDAKSCKTDSKLNIISEV